MPFIILVQTLGAVCYDRGFSLVSKFLWCREIFHFYFFSSESVYEIRSLCQNSIMSINASFSRSPFLTSTLSSVVRILETHKHSSSTSTLRLSKLPLNICTKEFFSAHINFLVKSQKLLSLELTAILPLIYPLAFLHPFQYILSIDLNVSVFFK